MTLSPTQRFSDRVENYRRFRPRYPAEIIPFLEAEVGLTPSAVVADIGAGTGIFTEMLLRHGNTVYAVEPNDPMREAAEALLKDYPGLRSIRGTAEDPPLPDGSIDVITSAQAFHWFDAEKARAGFSRILRPGGPVVLIWNIRKTDSTPFLGAYEELLKTHSTEYPVVEDASLPERVRAFFGEREFRQREFANAQTVDLEGLVGRLLSASYIPNTGEPRAKVVAAAEALFREYSWNGAVTLEYTTNIYYGTLSRVGGASTRSQ